MKVKMAVVIRAGLVQRQHHPEEDLEGVAPSMYAASSSSRGMPRMNWTIRNTKNASVARNFGTISGQSCPPTPAAGRYVLRNQHHVVGSMIVATMKAKITALTGEPQPRERERGERARPGCRAREPTAMISELSSTG